MSVPGPGGKYITVDYDNPSGKALSPELASSQRDNLWQLQQQHANQRLFGQTGQPMSDEELLAEQQAQLEEEKKRKEAMMMAQMQAIQGVR